MTDAELVAAIVAGLSGTGGGIVMLGRWFGTIWRDIRREEIAASVKSADAQRADANRTIEVMREQAAATAALSVHVDNIPDRVAALLWREHTPVEGIPVGGEMRYRDRAPSDPPSERRQAVGRFPGDRPPGRPPNRRNE